MMRRLASISILSFVALSACSSNDEHPPTLVPDSSTFDDDTGRIDAATDTGSDSAEVATTCSNGTRDKTETDVDCGGGECAPCGLTLKCVKSEDCASGSCKAGSCVAATCSDGAKNGTETDVDCGGPTCPACDPGKMCSDPTHCKSGVCTGGLCVAGTCSDGVKNNTETDIDCGGSCGPCGVGKLCNATGDCTSAVCSVEGAVKRCTCASEMRRIQLTGPGGGAYCIDANEVNNLEYGVFLSTGPDPASQPPVCSWNDNFAPTSAWPAGAADKQLPVRYVDWCDARAYCEKQGKRLCGKIGGGANAPSDASNASSSQWYNTCSQGGSNVYPYPNLSGAASTWYREKACNGADFWTADAGVPTVYPRAAMPLSDCIGGPMGDILQLSGNVKEWEDSCNGAAGKADTCLTRGGSFHSNKEALKCIGAEALARDTHADDVGFRCCL